MLKAKETPKKEITKKLLQICTNLHCMVCAAILYPSRNPSLQRKCMVLDTGLCLCSGKLSTPAVRDGRFGRLR
jgi:hypothetical protein